MQTSQILKHSSIYARDLFSLQLTSRQEYRGLERSRRRRQNTLSAILPRGSEIVVSFGPIRAVVGTDCVWIFDAHSVVVKDFTEELQTLLALKEHPEEEHHGQPFELLVIESILKDTTDIFHRRIRLYEPIVDAFLSKVASEVFSDSGVHLLVPLKDSLQGFKMHVKQCLECLTELLNNDEDMLALMITEQELAKEQGLGELDLSRHNDVELLLEEYGRQLNNILFEINYMLQRLQSKQEFVQLALSSYRNRMIRMNLYMSISGLSLGIGTAIAGFFGMNLVSGIEMHPTAFYMVITGTTLTGAIVAASCFNFVSGKTMQNRAETRLNEIETLTNALSDMNALDVTIKKLLLDKSGMGEHEFHENLKQARESGTVTEAEVQLLFSALDQQKDGVLFFDDFEALQKQLIKQKSKVFTTTKESPTR